MNEMGMGFSMGGPEWVRGPARVVNGEVILDESRAETYRIRQANNLLFDLAMLNEDNPERLVPFVRRHGLLWHGPDELKREEGELRESVRDWIRVGQELTNAMNFFTDLREAERDKSTGLLRRSSSPFFSYIYRQCVANYETGWWTHEDYVGLASRTLALWIDEKLQGCRLGIVAAAEDIRPHYGQFLLIHHPPDLETAAYAELAMLIANQHDLKECQGCGRWFLPKSGKQKYCVPRCSERTRQRKHRRSQAE